jgi:hypothetical protein
VSRLLSRVCRCSALRVFLFCSCFASIGSLSPHTRIHSPPTSIARALLSEFSSSLVSFYFLYLSRTIFSYIHPSGQSHNSASLTVRGESTSCAYTNLLITACVALAVYPRQCTQTCASTNSWNGRDFSYHHRRACARLAKTQARAMDIPRNCFSVPGKRWVFPRSI